MTKAPEASASRPATLVMVVEDSPTQRELLTYSLGRTGGYEVLAEANGHGALQRLAAARPALIISDVLMPVMDGYELCRRIKADPALREIPVVLLTSLSNREDLVRALECGADSFFAKPLDIPYLLSQIERILQRGPARPEDDGSELEVWLGERPVRIAARKRQILDMLLSAYEAAVKKNADLIESQRALKNFNDELESKVRDRTAKLEESNTSLEAFCYSIAHDLRAPLRAIQGMVTALVSDYGEAFDDTGRDYARRACNAAERMDRLIFDLLAFGKVSQAQIRVEPVHVRKAVEHALHALDAEVRASQGTVEFEGEDDAALGSRVLIDQILLNLIGNALKFRAPGRPPRIVIRMWKENGQTVIAVEDNGIGIEAAFHQKIFRIFERINPDERFSGTGIGLAIVQKAVEKMGGRIELRSEMGAGSVFTIFLPETPPAGG